MDEERKMRDTIYRQAAIDALADMYHAAERWGEEATDCVIKARAESCLASLVEMKLRIEKLPSAQPEISRIEQELHGKTPEEQYEFIYWLLLKFGLGYTDSRLAILEWLRGEKEDG